MNDTCDDSCAACGKSDGPLKRCSACRSVRYCGVDCQRSHRPEHRKKCKELSNAAKLYNAIKEADRALQRKMLAIEVKENEHNDPDLFKPPPKPDCAICMLPWSGLLASNRMNERVPISRRCTQNEIWMAWVEVMQNARGLCNRSFFVSCNQLASAWKVFLHASLVPGVRSLSLPSSPLIPPRQAFVPFCCLGCIESKNNTRECEH